MKKFIPLFLVFMFFFLGSSVSAQDEVPILHQGMRGEDVWELQQLLDEIGYNIEVDGHFGPETKTIVEAFQSSFDLNSDGIVGPKTWNVLRQVNPFLKYVIQPGDTLSKIARKFNTTVKAIKLANNLSTEIIFPDQEIKIPRSWMGGGEHDPFSSLMRYEIEPGDTLSKLGRRFDIPVRELKEKNNLSSDMIVVGQTLEIPNQKPFGSQQIQAGDMLWPARGRITSPFGHRVHPIYGTQQFHSGIDIALPRGTPIQATAAGLVTTSGGEGGFGKTIIIDHGNGLSSLYAHNDHLLVRAGAFVMPGQIIALSGNTGVSTGPHLHFEIRYRGAPVDPQKFLR